MWAFHLKLNIKQRLWHQPPWIFLIFGMQLCFMEKWKSAKFRPLTPYSSWDTGTHSQTLFPKKMSAPHRFCYSESYLFDNKFSSASGMVLTFCTPIVFEVRNSKMMLKNMRKEQIESYWQIDVNFMWKTYSFIADYQNSNIWKSTNTANFKFFIVILH